MLILRNLRCFQLNEKNITLSLRILGIIFFLTLLSNLGYSQICLTPDPDPNDQTLAIEDNSISSGIFEVTDDSPIIYIKMKAIIIRSDDAENFSLGNSDHIDYITSAFNFMPKVFSVI